MAVNQDTLGAAIAIAKSIGGGGGGGSSLPDPVTIAHGGTGATTQTAAKTNLGLGNVDNTSDLNKPVSLATQQAINDVRTKQETVSGTDIAIIGVANTRYICGTLSTLDFTPPAEGIVDIIFTSGSSKTILTLPNTVKMPDWFEVEANMTYEISIADGVYGVVTSWAV